MNDMEHEGVPSELSRRDLARLLSSIERGDQITLPAIIQDAPWRILGVTGAPGVGKSCLVNAIASHWIRVHDRRIAILPVDPSSPRTGGALLGDRIRMQAIDDPELSDRMYVRSVATRRTSGSVPMTVARMAEALLASGWDRVIIETVGSGQSDLRVACMADLLLLVEGPHAGDGVQAEKAGRIEVADALVVNKADLPDSVRVRNELVESLLLGAEVAPEVLLVSARTGDGVDALCDHLESLRANHAARRIRAFQRLIGAWEERLTAHDDLDAVLDDLSEGRIDTVAAVARIGGWGHG